MVTRSLLMHSYCGVIEHCSGCHGRKTNKWVLEKIGSVLMMRKSMAERNAPDGRIPQREEVEMVCACVCAKAR